MRPGSRKLNAKQLENEVRGRHYQAFEESMWSKKVGYFTIATVVDRSGVLRSSKTSKPFMSFKISDLQKYEMVKVRKALTQ